MGRLTRARTLHPGTAEGDLLVLAPLSFWGGTDPELGTIVDRHHPRCGTTVTGKVLAMTASRGSSSSSSVLAEMIRLGTAPAALLLTAADPILTIGAAVASTLYAIDLPIALLGKADFAVLPRGGGRARVQATDSGAVVGLLPAAP